MNLVKKTPNFKVAFTAALVFFLSLGCLFLPAAPTPTGALVPTSPPTPDPQPTPTLSDKLNAKGPWLLMETDQGLWAVNPDGSGLTQLTEVDYWGGNLARAIQPGGNLVAFIAPGNGDFHNMSLNLISLPDGKITKITDLTSAETEAYAGSGLGVPGFEALRAVGEQRSYAWGAGGALLAFAGAMDGPTADIYIYNVNTRGIQQVSQDGAQDYAPSWSPYTGNGYHLLYLEANGFGTGAGFAMAGVWSADVSFSEGRASEPALLYVPDSPGEQIVGWLDSDRAILSSWSSLCGTARLRIYAVASRQETMINAGCFIDAAVDAGDTRVVFADEIGVYTCYYASGQSLCPYRLDERRVADLRQIRYTFHTPWTVAYAGSFDDGGMAVYMPGSRFSPVNAASMDAAVGNDLAWTSEDPAQPGVWLTDLNGVSLQIFSERARLPVWGPTNQLLFFAPNEAGGYDIHLARFDAFTFRDLASIDTIPADVYAVAWLEGE